jgi:hypothetical protein
MLQLIVSFSKEASMWSIENVSCDGKNKHHIDGRRSSHGICEKFASKPV